MGKHVTVAVVGAGMAGQAHAFGYRNATMHPDLAGVDVRLSAIVDFNPELARSVADRYGFATATTDIATACYLTDYASTPATPLSWPARGVGSGYGAAFVAQAQDFLGAILDHHEVASSFWTGNQTMLVCDAVQQASAERHPVDIAALDAKYRS